jgi:hypothetical protein
MRRGDCKYHFFPLSFQAEGDAIAVLRLGWVTDMEPEAHVQRVKERLGSGRDILMDLHFSADLSTYDLDGAQPDPEQATLQPPHGDDPFFVATDERDPEARQKIADAGAIFLSDLLTMDDRREFGWSIMITDVLALVEQQLLSHSSFFYAHAYEFAGGRDHESARGAWRRPTDHDYRLIVDHHCYCGILYVFASEIALVDISVIIYLSFSLSIWVVGLVVGVQ